MGIVITVHKVFLEELTDGCRGQCQLLPISTCIILKSVVDLKIISFDCHFFGVDFSGQTAEVSHRGHFEAFRRD